MMLIGLTDVLKNYTVFKRYFMSMKFYAMVSSHLTRNSATLRIEVYKHLRPKANVYHFSQMRACATKAFFFTSD